MSTVAVINISIEGSSNAIEVSLRAVAVKAARVNFDYLTRARASLAEVRAAELQLSRADAALRAALSHSIANPSR